MDKLRRYIIFFIGLFINSFGVSLITKASLGTSPISSIPYVLSLKFPPTLGNFTIIFSVLLVVLQFFILRKNFKLEHLLQIPISILFGFFIDLTMVMLTSVNPQTYVMKVVYLLIGCLILGFGVYTEVLANVAMLPGESFVRAIVQTWNREFGITKIIFDSSMTIIAGVLSVVFFHRLEGVREGTIVAALLVGFIARTIGRKLSFLEPILLGTGKKQEAAPQEGEMQVAFADGKRHANVIVIGRQFGAGGSEFGRMLAKRLGYQFYDKEIIQMTAGTTGYTSEFVKKREETMTNSLLYDLVNQMYMYSPEHDAPKDKIFEAESNVMKDLARQGNCVIIGRCSDYVLKDEKNCLRIFFHASMESRMKRIMERNQLNEKDAKNKIQKEDKYRADNYRYYTRSVWGAAKNYHLCIDTDLGEEYVATLVEGALKNITIA